MKTSHPHFQVQGPETALSICRQRERGVSSLLSLQFGDIMDTFVSLVGPLKTKYCAVPISFGSSMHTD